MSITNLKIERDQVIPLGIWGKTIQPLTDQIKDIISSYFNIHNLEERENYVLKQEQLNFPFQLNDPNIDKKILEELSDIKDLEISVKPLDRIAHSIGKSYWDLIRLRNGKLTHLVDIVATPTTSNALKKLIKIANREKIPVIPVGGKTGVTEAVEPINRGIAINLLAMNKILDFQPENCLIKVEAGILLPDLEQWLQEHNFKLGHSPQSFMFTSVGGSISARGSGQHSGLYGPMRNLIHDLTIETPVGTFSNSNTLVPESAVGPDLTELFIGSEGALGVIVEADLKIRVFQKQDYKAFLFKSFEDGIKAIKDTFQAGYNPATVRLSDSEETQLFLSLASDYERSLKEKAIRKIGQSIIKRKGFIRNQRFLLITHYEGDSKIVNVTKDKVSNFCKKYNAFSLGGSPAKRWYETRYDLPYLRENLLQLGILADTLETSATWDNLLKLYSAAITNLRKFCPIAMAHVSHVYTEGASLYFTFMAKEDYNWEDPLIQRIRNSTIQIFLDNGGTISHHHGVGQAFKSFLPLERPLLSLEVLKAIKSTLDPKNILNPASGILTEDS
ncbi:MAG: FAD-binding oxidoreductase [Candidatus Hodarchaeales archaeon]